MITLNGRASLLVVHSSGRYAFTLRITQKYGLTRGTHSRWMLS